MGHTRTSRLAMLSLGLLSQAAVAENAIYLFGAISSSDADIDAGVYDTRLKRIGGEDTSFTLGVGYEFNEHISLEAIYQDFGKLTGSRDQCALPVCTSQSFGREAVDSAALAVSAIASFRIGDRLNGYGRLGLTNWEFDSGSGAYDDSGTDLHYGAGLRWSVDTDWAIFGEYTRLDLDVDTIGIGFRYGF